MTLVIGVDGGGTRTRAVIVDEGGKEIGRAEVPGAVVRADAPGEAARAVSEAVRAAAERAEIALPVGVMWTGLAGAGLGAGSSAVARALATEGLAKRVVVGTDVEAAFHDAFGDGPGILLIAGTGSIAWARDAAGSVIRVGGWGERLGDEGSGFAIGMEALRAVAHAEDGRGPQTVLRGQILDYLALTGCDQLVEWTSRARKRDVSALVPLVSQASSEGDPVATGILEKAVAELSAHLRAVLERAGQWAEPPELVLWGGLLRDGAPLHEAAVQAVSRYPVRLAAGDVDPAMGAARMALVALSETPDNG